MRIGPLLAGKWLCFFPQVPTFQSGRDLTLGEVGSSNPNFDRRCQQDRRVERRVIIFLIMHDCFPLVGINAVISSWARRFFKMEKKRKMRRMKERHREKGKTPRKRSEKEQRTGGTDRIFFLSWPRLKFPSCRNWIGYVPEPPGSEGSHAGLPEESSAGLSSATQTLPQNRCRIRTPSLELYGGLCISIFGKNNERSWCLFVCF